MSNIDDLKARCTEDYSRFLSHRNFLVDGEQKVSEGLDKAILAISSTALGFTFFIFKDFQLKGLIENSCFLQLSWLSLGASLFSVLVSLLLSGHIFYLDRVQTDKLLKNRLAILWEISENNCSDTDIVEFVEQVKLSRVARFFHYSGAITLIIGISTFGLYINSNL